MNSLWRQFKYLTGYNQSDIAHCFNISRQHVSKEIHNTSTTHKSAFALWLCLMLDKKIEELEQSIIHMKKLKKDIYENVQGGEQQ